MPVIPRCITISSNLKTCLSTLNRSIYFSCTPLFLHLSKYLLICTWPDIWVICSLFAHVTLMSVILCFSLLRFRLSGLSFCLHWKASNQCKWGLREQIVCLAPFHALSLSICQHDLKAPHSSCCLSSWTGWAINLSPHPFLLVLPPPPPPPLQTYFPSSFFSS